MNNLIEFHRPTNRGAVPSADRTSLTPREVEVLEMAHTTNSEIALALGCSVHTVRAHFRQIAVKLGAESRTQAYALWMERGDIRRAA